MDTGRAASLAPMTPDDLVEIELIKRLKYKYARCLDQKLWDEMAECFTADAHAAYSGGGYSFDGRDAIVDFLTRSMGAETFHVEPQDASPGDRPDGPHDGQRRLGARRRRGDDRLPADDPGLLVLQRRVRQADGVWRIQRTGYKRIYEEMQPRGNVEGLQLTASWWATGGRSELPAG